MLGIQKTATTTAEAIVDFFRRNPKKARELLEAAAADAKAAKPIAEGGADAVKTGAKDAAKTAGDLARGAEKGSETGKVVAPKTTPRDPLVARIQDKLNRYPQVIDPRTGRHIPFPSGIRGRVSQAQRVAPLTKAEKQAFEKEWARRGYSEPRGGWDKYDLHHILPREFGGTHDFWNLVPVERKTHQSLFNTFWREFTGL